jgi:hypothetical protein
MKTFVAAACVAGMLGIPCLAEEGSAPQELSVWARVQFGADGKPTDFAIADEARYPPKLVENVKARLARATVEPPMAEGQPATMRTGVEVRFEIVKSEQGTTVKAAGLTISPFPLVKDAGAETLKIGGWKGEVTVVCQVGVEGKCVSTEIVASPAPPENLRRYAKTSLDKWRFEPQQVGGKPVQSEYRHRIIVLDTADYKAPDDFRNKVVK